MSSPLVPSLRQATVTAVTAGPPPRVTIALGGDTSGATVAAPYLDAYTPASGDVVSVLIAAGAPLVLGKAAAGTRRAAGRVTANVTPITSTEVDLVVLPAALVLDGASDVLLTWSWDSLVSTVASDRFGFRPKASFNGGAYTQVGREVVRVVVGSSSEAGGAGSLWIPAPAAGAWTYKLVGVREGGTGTFTVNAGDGTTVSPITFTAERWT